MYMSTDARKVVNALRFHQIELESTYEIELTLGKYYPNHVIQTVNRICPQDPEGRERARLAGWAYFGKPCNQLLSSRTGAIRSEPLRPTDGAERVYNVVRTNLLLSDFGFAELQILTGELPSLVETSFENLYKAMGACKAGNARNVYYLRGVLTREAQIAEGRQREVTEASAEAEARAWAPPEGHSPLDPSERAEVTLDWQEKLKDIELDHFFNDLRNCKD